MWRGGGGGVLQRKMIDISTEEEDAPDILGNRAVLDGHISEGEALIIGWS